MTREEILNMPAGREMDALVAEKVMGADTKQYYRLDGIPWHKHDLPAYSTEIDAAWKVIKGLEYNWNLCRDVGKCGSDYETAGDMNYRFIYTAPGMPMEGITADTAPLAICRAALLAVIGREVVE